MTTFIFGESSDGVPVADGFDFPVGPRGANVDVFRTHKIDATLADPAYFKSFGAWHPGEDWNGRGGGDTDLGDPIYAIANGRVVEFGYYPPVWGNLVLIEHVQPDGMRVWSQYAHLDRIMVTQKGEIIERGRQIGTMGKGAKTNDAPRGRFIAHLHFEIRRNNLPIGNWTPMVKDKNAVLANYISPTPFINARRPGTGIFVKTETTAAAQPQPAKPPVNLVIDAEQPTHENGTFHKAEADQWYSAPYGFNGAMLWTYSSPATERNWAEWRPNLSEAGQWQVWAFIPAQYGTTTSARYLITHLDGQILIGLDQSQYSHKWAYLGTYRFGPGQAAVRLNDVTGEDGQTPTMVAFDALCWTKAD